MITRMHILLEPKMDEGTVALFEEKQFVCGGDASTDLLPGRYQVVADSGRKRWNIVQYGARGNSEHTGLRFTLSLDGPDPFALSYANPVQLEISSARTADSYMPDPFIDVLGEVGPDAYKGNPSYVDNGIEGGEFDIFGGSFILRYEKGKTFELTNHISWATLASQVKGRTQIYTYYKLKPPASDKILPRFFDKTSAPNITAMVGQIEQAIGGAQAAQQLGRILLDQVQIGPRPLGRGVTGTSAPRPMRMRQMPKQRIAPVNGTVNVGGGPKDGVGVTNLNPIVPGTGGPTAGQIPNHVAAGFEDMGDIFHYGSVNVVKSSRLPFGTVNWQQSATASYRVMATGGRLHLNVWTQSQSEVDQVIQAFTNAGFRNVQNSTKLVGAGTIITGVK